MIMHGSLKKFHSGKPLYQIFRGQKHDHSCTAADHDRIHKYTQGLDKSGFYRTVTFCCRCCTGSGAASRLIGKKASFYSVHQHDAKSAGNSLTKSESFFKNPFKYSRHTSKICKYNKQRDHKIKHCHHRHQKIQNFNRCILPKHDHSCDHYQHDGSIHRRNIKSIFERRRDGIADNLTDPTPADQAGNSKQNGKQNLFSFSALFFFPVTVDIVGRTAPVATIKRILFFIELCQGCFDKSSGGTDQRRDPHPEYRSCTSCRDRSYHTDQVSHSHTGSCRYDQRLKC